MNHFPFTAQLRHPPGAAAVRLAWLLPLIACGLAAASAGAQVPAATAPGPAALPVAAESQPYTIPLSQLAGHERPVRLAGTAASTTLSLPLPALMRTQNVRLELVGTASRALNAVSQLEVAVNGRVVRQMGLSGEGDGHFRHTIELPASALREGFNDVQIRVAQHYADQCEYPMAPQLWTEVSLAESRFVVTASPAALAPRLDRLNALFDKAVLTEAPPVSVLTASALQGDVLRAAGLVAQGLGHRYDYVPVRIGTGRFPASLAALGAALPAGARSAVVMGTFGQLGSYLEGLGLPTDAGPVVAVRTLPDDPTRFVVILAAATEADLPVAATAFAMRRMPWPAKPWVALRDLKLPPQDLVDEAAEAQASATRAVPFSALGYATSTYTGLPTGGATVRFWNSNWQGRVQVRLHLNYSSGMAAASALNVLANGVMHGSIPLNNPAGGVFNNYAVSVPTGSLRIGWNTLELQPVLVPQSNGGECKPFFVGNLATTIYEDSTLQLFGGNQLTRPDLGLMARDGRGSPLPPLGAGMAVQLTDAEDGTVAAGLTLMAKLAQVLRIPLLRSTLGVGQDEQANIRFWVGATDRLPQAVRDRTRLQTAGRLQLDVPLMQAVGVPVLEGSDTLMQLRRAIEGTPSQPLLLGAEVALSDGTVNHTVAATAFDGKHPLTVFTAATPADLEAGLHHVVGYGPWAQLRGGMAYWRPGEPVTAVISEDAPFTAYALRGSIGLWVSQYPWWSLAIVLGMIALLVGLTRAVLARYRQRNLPAQTERRVENKP